MPQPQDASRMDDARDGASATLMPSTRRFSITRAPDASGLALVEGAELHHMRTVLRLPVDSRVSLLDPAGVEHQGVIDRYDRDRALIRIESSSISPARPRIILAAAIIKGPRMDIIVEKAAELGASELWPLVCARGLVRAPGVERLARWSRLTLAAATQSQAPSPINVRAPVSLDDLIHSVPRETLAVICTQTAEPLSRVIRRAHPRA